MIIGVHAKIGHGKDTVGKIIQELRPDKKWEIKKWATKLKQTATLLTGVPVEMWEDQDFKKMTMTGDWGMTYREFLQKLGTDAMREGLHKEVWVNALMSDYVPVVTPDFVYGYGVRFPNWIITDTRFPNEADAVGKKGGICLRVVRPCDECGGLYTHKMSCFRHLRHPEMLHASETSLDNYSFDYTIENTGDLAELKEKVETFLKQFNLW